MFTLNLSARTNHLTLGSTESLLVTTLMAALYLTNGMDAHAATNATYGHVEAAVKEALRIGLRTPEGGSGEDADDVWAAMLHNGEPVIETIEYLNGRRRAAREAEAAEAEAWGPCPRCGVTGLIVEDDPSVAHCDVCGTTSWR